MDRIYFFILIGFVLLAVTTYHYALPQPSQIEQVCDSQMSVCAICPLFQPKSQHYDINANTYIVHKGEFAAIVSLQDMAFKKNMCSDYLRIVNSYLTIQPNQQLKQYISSGKIVLRSSLELGLFTSGMHSLILNKVSDFVIFTKKSNSKPQIFIQNSRNSVNLLKYSNIVGWSSLLTLIIVYSTHKMGFSLFNIEQSSKPFLQITAIIFSLFCSNDSLFFNYFSLIKATYIAILYLRMNQETSKSKYFCALWIVSCIAQSNSVFIGQAYLTYLFIKRNIINGLYMRISAIYIVFGLFVNILRLLLPFNLLAYFHVLWTVIYSPIMLLMLQTKQWQQQCQKQ